MNRKNIRRMENKIDIVLRHREKSEKNFFLLYSWRFLNLKENPKGVQEMCKVMEDMRNETVLEERRRIARTFLLMGELSYEKIAEGTKLSIEEIEKLAEREEE